MATHAHSTAAPALLSLIGRTPAHPVQVSRRPTSFADALAQYRQASLDGGVMVALLTGATADQEATVEHLLDATIEGAVDAADDLASFPSPDLSGLLAKIEAVARDGDWMLHGPLIAKDARRLGGAA